MNKTPAILALVTLLAASVPPLSAQNHSYEVKRLDFRFDSLSNQKELQGVLKEYGDGALDGRFTPLVEDASSTEKGHCFFSFFHSGDWVMGLSVEGPVLPAKDWPGGSVEIEFRDTARNATIGGAPYILRYFLGEERRGPERGRAPNPAWWLYHLERRFPSTPRLLEIAPVMTFGSDYSSLPGRRALLVRKAEGGWFFLVKISWQDLYGHWPFTRLGVADTWRVRLTRKTASGGLYVWGAKDGEGRIRWPKMTPDVMESFCKSMTLGQAVETYEKELDDQKDLYMAARRDKHFGHVKTRGPNHHLYDLDTSERFLQVGIGAVEKGNENLIKAIKPKKKGQHSPLFSQPPALREKLMGELDRIFHVDETLEIARRDFLRNELLGRKTEPAKQKAAAKKKSGGEEMDAIWNDDGGEKIQLDDLEF